MDKRFVLFGVVLALIVTMAAASLQVQSGSIFQVFFWLLLLLVVSGLALWPRSGADQQTEFRLERRGWADRIEFKGAGQDEAQPVGSTRSRPSD